MLCLSVKKKKNKTLGIEELIFLFYLPFGFGSFLLRGGLSFPWCFSSLLVSSPDTAQFLQLSRKSEQVFEKPVL